MSCSWSLSVFNIRVIVFLIQAQKSLCMCRSVCCLVESGYVDVCQHCCRIPCNLVVVDRECWWWSPFRSLIYVYTSWVTMTDVEVPSPSTRPFSFTRATSFWLEAKEVNCACIIKFKKTSCPAGWPLLKIHEQKLSGFVASAYSTITLTMYVCASTDKSTTNRSIVLHCLPAWFRFTTRLYSLYHYCMYTVSPSMRHVNQWEG